jgi:Cu/Ag efflux protein CusF
MQRYEAEFFKRELSPSLWYQRKGGKEMKKLFTILLGCIFAASILGTGMAQEKSKKEEPAPAVKSAAEKPAQQAKAKEPQGKALQPITWRAGGAVNAFDPKSKILTVHQVTLHHDRVLKLKVGEKAMKGIPELKPGDLVNIWITDGTITALNKVG